MLHLLRLASLLDSVSNFKRGPRRPIAGWRFSGCRKLAAESPQKRTISLAASRAVSERCGIGRGIGCAASSNWRSSGTEIRDLRGREDVKYAKYTNVRPKERPGWQIISIAQQSERFFPKATEAFLSLDPFSSLSSHAPHSEAQ